MAGPAFELPAAKRPAGPRRSWGLLAMIGSALLFSVMALLVKCLPRFGTFELVFWRSVFMSLGSLVMLAASGVSPLGLPGTRLLLSVRGVAGFGFMGGFYYAIKLLPLSDAVVITYTSPVITAVAAALLLKEPFEKIDMVGSLLCMTGVVMISKPSSVMSLFGAPTQPLPARGVCAAICSALFSTSVYILLRYGKDLHPIVSVNYFAVAGVFIAPAFCAAFGEPWVWPEGAEWLQLFLLAWLSIAGQALMNVGLSLESAGKATAMNYVQVVFAYVFQIFLLHERSDVLSVVGAALIASWGAIAVVKDARQKKRVAQEAFLAAEEDEGAPQKQRSCVDVVFHGAGDAADAVKHQVSFSG
uniref:EamA domain-containing protein n=1 Tax=Alexandrium monilatum TaxID=311494 RepID=A0A7S4Q6Z8_9DINO